MMIVCKIRREGYCEQSPTPGYITIFGPSGLKNAVKYCIEYPDPATNLLGRENQDEEPACTYRRNTGKKRAIVSGQCGSR